MKFAGRGCALSWAVLGLLSCLLPGCGDSKYKVYPVHGEVFFDGQPASGATIHFHPVDTARPPAFATVQPDGSYELSTYGEDDGAVAGDYLVTLNWIDEEKIDGEMVAGPDRLGGHYARAESSGLKATVDAGEDNEVPRFDLKKQ